jgi:glycosidase
MHELKSVTDPVVQDLICNSGSKEFHNSPEAWEDQLFYFLLPDRFSNNREGGYKDVNGRHVPGPIPLYSEQDRNNALDGEDGREHWLHSGMIFVGGTLQGATSKLGYLKRMGVTAIWLGPIFKQIAALETYHGYAIQDFLDVESRFGTRDDLKEFVQCAHRQGIYVILDIVLNHCGDVFEYRNKTPYTGKVHSVQGFWNSDRSRTLPFEKLDESKYPKAFPDSAVWPRELQDAKNFLRMGMMQHWDAVPEVFEADFYELKSLNLGPIEDTDDFAPGAALITLCQVYRYWIALLDIDGYRMDTVYHMGDGPTKYFVSNWEKTISSLLAKYLETML